MKSTHVIVWNYFISKRKVIYVPAPFKDCQQKWPLCFFPEMWSICSYWLFSLQTEEDYIPYPSVHEVLLTYAVYAWQILKLSAVIILCLYFYASFYLFQLRCSVVLVRFHSSFCPSSVATGSRGPIITLQSRQKLISLLVLPPISNWRQTAQLKYTGSISWGR